MLSGWKTDFQKLRIEPRPLRSEARNHDLSVHNLYRPLDQSTSRNAVETVAYFTSFLRRIAFRYENDAFPGVELHDLFRKALPL